MKEYGNVTREYLKQISNYISRIVNDKDIELMFYKYINSPRQKQFEFVNKSPQYVNQFSHLEEKLVYEAEKLARSNPLYALSFLSFTTNLTLSEQQLKRREALIEYCLLKVKYEDILGLPFWLRTKYGFLHSKEKERITVDIDSGLYLAIYRDEKTYIWNFDIYSNEQKKSSGTFPLFVLSARKVNYKVYKNDNFEVIIKTPFVEYKFIISSLNHELINAILIADKRAKKHIPAKVKILSEENKQQ